MADLAGDSRGSLNDFLAAVLAGDPGRAGVAVWMDTDGSTETAIHPGQPPADAATFFEIGSLTKTMTATLLADLVIAGETELTTTMGDVLGAGVASACADITLLQLATHTSGLPRLAPNAMRLPFWPRDPYRFYGRRRLERGLARMKPRPDGTIRYSNVGYDLLGELLGEIGGAPFGRLLEDRVLRPAGMSTARCQPCSSTGLAKGKGHLILGGRRWHQRLAGKGGVDATLSDLTAWLGANLRPDSTPLAAAVRLCHREHAKDDAVRHGLAWARGRTIWHNGGTGCFQSMLAFEPGTGGVALAIASGKASYDELLNAFLRARLGPIADED